MTTALAITTTRTMEIRKMTANTNAASGRIITSRSDKEEPEKLFIQLVLLILVSKCR
jgi:hypothetical protein